MIGFECIRVVLARRSSWCRAMKCGIRIPVLGVTAPATPRYCYRRGFPRVLERLSDTRVAGHQLVIMAVGQQEEGRPVTH